MESEVHSSLHPRCHHQVVFAKFNLSILYSPPYDRTVWVYEMQTLNLSEELLMNLITNHTAVLIEISFFSKSLNFLQNQLNAIKCVNSEF